MADDEGTFETRTQRKRRAIREAATELFLRDGYHGTSMDQIAALAAVSKQTVYKQFESKEQLFASILQGVAERAGGFIAAATRMLRETDDLAADLHQLARHYLETVLQPEVVQLRRLILAEAHRLPEVARDYYERVPGRTLGALAASFEELAGRGLLRVEDPRLAAGHFAFLILGIPLDRALFLGHDGSLAGPALERHAAAGVRAFLAAYGVPGSSGKGRSGGDQAISRRSA